MSKSSIIISKTTAKTRFSHWTITTTAFVQDTRPTVFSAYFFKAEDEAEDSDSFTETFTSFEAAAAYIRSWCAENKAEAHDVRSAFVVTRTSTLQHGLEIFPGEEIELAAHGAQLEATSDLMSFADYGQAEAYMLKRMAAQSAPYPYDGCFSSSYCIERRRLAEIVGL